MKKYLMLGVLLAVSTSVYASSGSLSEYTLDPVDVTAVRESDQFGNPITEQSYYRTGGDVQVITEKDIDNNNFPQVSDALKRIPGVRVSTAGYRGGEFGYANTHSIVSINGDSRVVVTIDGRRVDNDAKDMISTRSSRAKSNVDINEVANMDSIKEIEVIKGPGASVYGSDATGGVINIITKKGQIKPKTTVDLSFGSWARKNFGITHSGSNKSGNFRYFVSAKRELSGDSKYVDGLNHNTYTFKNTGYHDDSLYVNMDYDLSKDKNISFSYRNLNADDDYPLTAPYYKYMDAKNWQRIKDDYFKNDKYGNAKNPGYRNLWYMWAWTGAYNAYSKKSYDLTYNFDKSGKIPSFVRVYNLNESYAGSFGRGDDENAPTPNTPEWYKWAKDNYFTHDKKGWQHFLRKTGAEIQLGKVKGIHNIIFDADVSKSSYENINSRKNTHSTTKRTVLNSYIQDKIKVNHGFYITPALRYVHYSGVAQLNHDGTSENIGKSVGKMTPMLNAEFLLGKKTSAYFGYTKVYRPLKASDYSTTNKINGVNMNAALEDETGAAYNVGIRHDISDKTNISLNASYTDMKNAVARYNVWNKEINDFALKYVNATQTQKAFNVTLLHRFNDNISMSLNYSYYKDKWNAKNGVVFDPDLSWANGDINTAINKVQANRVYTGILNYDNDKTHASLIANYYAGLDREVYTNSHFLVIDLNTSYKLNKDTSLYFNIQNLGNIAWESTATYYLGIGGWPQPARTFLFGIKHTL